MNETVFHLAANPVARIAVDLDPAPLHVGAQMHADRAMYGDASLGHRPSDPAYFVQSAVNGEVFALLSIDVEEFAQRQLSLAVINCERFDVCVRERTDSVGRKDFGLQGNRGLAFEVEGD